MIPRPRWKETRGSSAQGVVVGWLVVLIRGLSSPEDVNDLLHIIPWRFGSDHDFLPFF